MSNSVLYFLSRSALKTKENIGRILTVHCMPLLMWYRWKTHYSYTLSVADMVFLFLNKNSKVRCLFSTKNRTYQESKHSFLFSLPSKDMGSGRFVTSLMKSFRAHKTESLQFQWISSARDTTYSLSTRLRHKGGCYGPFHSFFRSEEFRPEAKIRDQQCMRWISKELQTKLQTIHSLKS